MALPTGIILAAGASERMGEPKLLLPYKDATLLNATIAAVVASRLKRIVVVTGAKGDEIEASITDRSIVSIRNPDYRRGNMSSLLTATVAESHADAFILVAGDLPEVTTQSFDALVDLWDNSHPWAAVMEYEDRIAYPFLLSRSAIDEMADLQGTKVLWRALVESGDPRAVRYTFAQPAPLDVNTPSDYAGLE